MDSFFQIIQRRVSDPNHLFDYFLCKIGPIIPDKLFLKLRFKLKTGKRLDLDDPKTFNEKLQWLKLYDRQPEYSKMVDKVEAKKYVAGIIGDEHLIPTLAVYDNVEDIDFESLPNQFVLKCTHDSGGIVICHDKNILEINKAIKKLAKSIRTNFFFQNREWPYKNIKPRIIAEQYMSESGSEGLTDFKVHCFNGIPKIILVCRDRFEKNGLTEDFFSCTWEHLDISRPNHKNAEVQIEKPIELDEMLRLSELLSKGIPFVRTDFYSINHKVYFGELTFYPASGMQSFVPEQWDTILGEWLNIPSRVECNLK